MTVVGLVLATEPAGGLSATVPDALCVLDGLPLVAHAVRTLALSTAVGAVAVAVPEGAAADVRAALDRSVPGHRAVVVDGGSVPAALAHAWAAADVTVLHDVRRPLAPVELVTRVLDALGAGVGARGDGIDAAVPVVEVVETVKELDPHGWIVRTVPRDALRQVQSPRAVRTSALFAVEGSAATGAPDDAHRTVVTDLPYLDAVLSGVAGWDPFVTPSRVVTVAGHADAFALRAPPDLDLAAAMLAARRGLTRSG